MKMLLAAIVMLGFLPLNAARADGAGDIGGAWSGNYTQRMETGDQTVPFIANINASGAAFTGMTREPNRTQTPDSALFATLTGSENGDSVTFTKTYGSSGWSHSIEYAGRFVAANRIEGTWRLEGASGPFVMTRN